MSNLSTDNQLNDYNSEQVFYCKHCLSLTIMHIPRVEDSEYCDKCGATDVETCSIEEWEELYEKKYGHKFLEQY